MVASVRINFIWLPFNQKGLFLVAAFFFFLTWCASHLIARFLVVRRSLSLLFINCAIIPQLAPLKVRWPPNWTMTRVCVSVLHAVLTACSVRLTLHPLCCCCWSLTAAWEFSYDNWFPLWCGGSGWNGKLTREVPRVKMCDSGFLRKDCRASSAKKRLVEIQNVRNKTPQFSLPGLMLGIKILSSK